MSFLMKHILYCQKLCNKIYINNPNILEKLILKILYKYYSSYLSIIYGAYLPYGAKLGKNITFQHGLYGVFISQNAIIGDNCVILHHVTIGSNIQKNNGITESPILCNNIFIGCNVNIIGRSIINNNVKIGAGVTIVNKEIAEYSTVYNKSTVIVEKKGDCK